MSNTTTRLLRRLLDEPGPLETIRVLPPVHFATLVASVGLEDCGELLAMATVEQMQGVLDHELWRAEPTDVESRLDAPRFAIWLEVLLEGGDGLVARRLSELPEELLSAGLCGQLFVLSIDALGHDMAGVCGEEAQRIERVLDECLYLEFGRHTLVARYGLGWDPTLAALLALDRIDHALVERVLDRCHQATLEELADDGITMLLRAAETLEEDARAERDDRGERRGYVSRASATSFLALAEQTSLDDVETLCEDPVTQAYFRELERPAVAGARAPMPQGSPIRELAEHLGELGRATEALVEPEAGGQPSSSIADVRQAMQALHAVDPVRHAQQVDRLGFLANVLMAIGRRGGESPGPLEASEQTMRVVARGMVHAGARTVGGEGPVEVLRRFGVDALFRLGWRLEPVEGVVVAVRTVPGTFHPVPPRGRG